MSCGLEIFDVQHFETQETLLLIETYHLIHQNWKDKEKEDDIFICYIQTPLRDFQISLIVYRRCEIARDR